MKSRIRLAGLVLIVIAMASFALTATIKQENTYEAVTFSDIVEAGKSEETYYHTTLFAKSKLIGNLTVEGGNIYFQVIGSNLDEKRYMRDKILVEGSYDFSFSAEDLYYFVFNNTHSDKDKKVTFNLREQAVETPHMLTQFTVISLLFILPAGLILFIADYAYGRWRKRKNKPGKR